MVNDLKPSFDLVKYVDGSTTWEILSKDSQSHIPSIVSQCEHWASANNMKLNASKTKELRVNFSACPPSFPPIVINNQPVDIVKHVKLLGVTISDDLKWNSHVDVICTKASKRLYALRLLKRSALPDLVLVNVYSTCVRPILEYACEAWHSCLPTYLSDQIESVQRRALRIVYPSINYTQAMQAAKIPILYERRSNLCERLFSKMLSPNHKLNSLVPPYNFNNYNLRHLRSFQIPVCRTDRFYKSFLPSAVRFYDEKF